MKSMLSLTLSLLAAAAITACGTPGVAPVASAPDQAVQAAQIQRVAVAPSLYELAYSARQNAVFVASSGGFGDGAGPSKLLRLDPATLAVQAETVLPLRGFGEVLDDAANRLYVGNTTEGSVTVVDTASSYRPYLAAWVEKAGDDKAVVGTLAVWYDTRLRDNGGRGWLRHLRSWWRVTGEQLALPADGVSGATRPAGTHTLQFSDASGALAGLPAGPYQLAIEVARENGGRELLRLPFAWGGPAGSAEAQGSKEIGKVSLRSAP